MDNKKQERTKNKQRCSINTTACCETVVASTDKDCPNCGSHNIRSPLILDFLYCCMSRSSDYR